MSESKTTAQPVGGGDWKPIGLLEKIRKEGRVWGDLAAQYGVTHPEPPWKTSLEGMCDALGGNTCSTSTGLDHQWLDGAIDRAAVARQAALPALERRWEEDELSETIYRDVPFPERQLLALTHSLISRGLLKEEELERRLEQVHKRLTSG
jgi:hypothetical protein